MDPVTMSVLASALAGVAEEMGTVLVRSAYSSNIKERRDCSAALFDADGRLVAQAAHIPVHLGAMPESVRAVRARGAVPGDVWMLNDPFSGGNHLPDITLVSPVDVDGEAVGYAATRAHHSDVGGMRPGSMPADSREIYQEGLVIPPVRLVAAGVWVEDVLTLIKANSRTPELRSGDLAAQVSANRLATTRLRELADRRGTDVVLAAFHEVIVYGERRSRQLIRGFPDGRYDASGEIEGDGVDDADIPIRVAVTIDGDEMTVDFTGTSGAVPGNVNCPLAVTRSACCFALRVLPGVRWSPSSHRVIVRAPRGADGDRLRPAGHGLLTSDVSRLRSAPRPPPDPSSPPAARRGAQRMRRAPETEDRSPGSYARLRSPLHSVALPALQMIV
jgi:N-methylhydantoinase B